MSGVILVIVLGFRRTIIEDINLLSLKYFSVTGGKINGTEWTVVSSGIYL